MKVLYIVHNPTAAGGAYYRAINLGSALAMRGHKITIMAIHPLRRFGIRRSLINGIEHIETGDLFSGRARSGWDPLSIITRSYATGTDQYDLIHCVDTRPAVSLPAMYANFLRKTPWIADWTDWWSRGGAATERGGGVSNGLIAPIEQFFEEKPRRYADKTIVISKALLQRAVSLGIPETSILYLPPATDPKSIRSTIKSDARITLGLSVTAKIIGYLGNIYQRDADFLFEVLAGISDGDSRLLMVGSPGCKIPTQLEGRITVTGRCEFETMLRYLSACDVLALPLSDNVTNRGRWPSKINEYLAVGRPVVACDVGDVAALLKKSGAGLVAAPDPAAFRVALQQVLTDEGLAVKMGLAARNLACGEYSQAGLASRLESFYLDCLATSNQRKD